MKNKTLAKKRFGLPYKNYMSNSKALENLHLTSLVLGYTFTLKRERIGKRNIVHITIQKCNTIFTINLYYKRGLFSKKMVVKSIEHPINQLDLLSIRRDNNLQKLITETISKL